MMIKIKTGFGYFIESASGKIISKAELPPGDHSIKPGYDYVEVNTTAELDAVEIYQEPETQNQKNEKLIQQKMTEMTRSAAIAALQAEGKL